MARRALTVTSLIGLLLCGTIPETANAQQDAWALLKQPGHIMLMRSQGEATQTRYIRVAT